MSARGIDHHPLCGCTECLKLKGFDLEGLSGIIRVPPGAPLPPLPPGYFFLPPDMLFEPGTPPPPGAIPVIPGVPLPGLPVTQPGAFVDPGAAPAGLTPAQQAAMLPSPLLPPYQPAPYIPLPYPEPVPPPAYLAPIPPLPTAPILPDPYPVAPPLPASPQYGVTPGMPAPSIPGMPAGATQESARARTALAQLTQKHTILGINGGFLQGPPVFPSVPQVPGVPSPLEAWYGAQVTAFEDLLQLALPLDTSVILGLRQWLAEIIPNRLFGASEIASLIRKEVLHQDVAFPEVELSTRILKFLKQVTPASYDDSLARMKTRAGLREQESRLVIQLFDAQAVVEQEKARTYVSGWEKRVADAQGQAAIISRSLDDVRTKIQALNDQIASLQNAQIGDEELFQLLLADLDDPEIRLDYQRQKDRLAYAMSLMKPFQQQIQANMDNRAPYFMELQDLKQNKKPALTNQVRAGTATQAQLDAVIARINELQIIVDRFSAANDKIEADKQVVIKANPTYFPPETGWALMDMSVFVPKYLIHMIDQKPDQLVDLLTKILGTSAKAADDQMKVLLADHEREAASENDQFQAFARTRIETKLKFYTDQITLAQKAYNDMSTELNQQYDALGKLQASISAQTDALGPVIGWMCNQNKISDLQMKQAWFINNALETIQAARGKYDKTTMSVGPISQTQQFWQGGGTSSEAASKLLEDMRTLDAKQIDYESGSGQRLRDQMVQTAQWIDSLKNAYEVTYKTVNTPEYVQGLVTEYNQTPERLAVKTALTQMATQLRDIQAMAQYDQERLSPLIDDIEESKLEAQGVEVPNTRYDEFDKKKKTWFGAQEYLEKAMAQYEFLTNTSNELAARVQAGTADADDVQHAEIIRVCFLNIMGAQLVVKRMQKDFDFQNRLNLEAESQAIDEVVQTKA